MKKIKTTFSLFGMLSFLLFAINTSAQNCPRPSTTEIIQGNKLKGAITVNGSLFNGIQGGGFEQIVSPSLPKVSNIFTGGLWLTAKNNVGELKTAATLFPSTASFDYVAGPINNDNGQISYDCENYDRLWNVFGSEIKQHNNDFEDNGIIDSPIPNIFSYPAQGNPFFEDIHGFALPNAPQGLAPFFDNNNDGIYNPTDGDFPLPSSVHENTIPSQILWGIFNDGGTTHGISQGQKLDAEIQLTVWAFECLDNEILNNTIFTSHKIINRSNEDLDSLTMGVFIDYDIGCYTDDYVGSAPDLNTFYGYNADSLDGTTGCQCNGGVATYCDDPPAQAITFLNTEMTSLMYFDNVNSDFEGYPSEPLHFYNLMNSRWKNGTPLTFGGSGYDGGSQVTDFVFSDNPNDNLAWTMASIQTSPIIDKKVIGSSHLGNFPMGEVVTVDMAYALHQDETMNNLEVVNLVYDNTPSIQASYDEKFETTCEEDFCFTDCVWAGDADNDSLVTGLDILQVGLAYAEAGPLRNSTIIWFPKNGDTWNNSVNGVDLKHTDCDGNGIISSSDFATVDGFFGNSYKTVEPLDTFPFGFELSFEQNINHPMQDMEAGDIGRIKLNINQPDSLFGLSLVIDYDTTFFSILPSAYIFNIWEDNSNDYILKKELPERGEIHLASVKTDGANGFTEIGSATGDLFFKSKVTNFQLVETLIRVKNIKAILNDGSTIDYGAFSFIASINNINGNGTILNNEDLEENAIEIFPNPTSDILNIKMENPFRKAFIF